MENEKKPTREEIVRSLRCCASDSCDGCPYSVQYSHDNEYPYDSECVRKMADAAADLIDQLTDRCARYAEEIMELRQVNDLSGASRHLPLKGEARTDRVIGPYEATADGPCVGADDPVRPNDDRNSHDRAG